MQALKLSRVFSYVGKLKRLNRLTHTSCIHLDEASATQQHSTDDEEAASLAAAELKKLEKMQDKSRLQVEHYKIFHRIPEPMNAVEQDVSSVREVRARYGRDGDASEVDLRYLWPSKQEMYYMKEFEKVVNPLRLPDMVTEAQREKAEAVTFAIKRQKEIIQNMKSLERWKADVRSNMKAKEDAAREAREKQSQLIEEVRLIYGARIDPQDEKFQEILAQKAEEEKKAQKALKKQRKQQAMMEQMKKLIEKAKQTESSTPTVNAEAPVKSPSDVQD